MQINENVKNGESFDAIVVGTGISGGWAVKELCEKGLKTLVIDPYNIPTTLPLNSIHGSSRITINSLLLKSRPTPH